MLTHALKCLALCVAPLVKAIALWKDILGAVSPALVAPQSKASQTMVTPNNNSDHTGFTSL